MNQFNSKFWKAAAKDELRPAMECVYFKNGYLYCTDGYLVVRQNLDIHNAFDNKEQRKFYDGKMLHSSVFPIITKAETIEWDEDKLIAEFGNKTIEISYKSEPQYPDAEKLIQEVLLFEKNPVNNIGVSHECISRIGDIMTIHTLCFTFTSKSTGIIVTSNDEVGLTGSLTEVIIMMPTLIMQP
jgi:hypothetical protein